MSTFPPSGGGSLSPAGLPSYQVFADPGGSSGASGSQGSPVNSIYTATQRALDHGGGTVCFNDGTPAGGPVTGQGIWLRNDGIDVPGFIDIQNSRLRYVGNGSSSGQFVFERLGAARMVGGTADFTTPAIWVVGSEVPVDFQFMKTYTPEFQGIPAPARIGWDYVRRTNFAAEQIDVTNATRAAGSTVFTLDLSVTEGLAIASAIRDGSDNVTLTLTRPLTLALAPWTIGCKIRVDTGGDTDFPDVDATVTNQSDILTLQGETTITVTYVQAGATISKALAGTVKSHGCQAGDYIATIMDSSEFVTCAQMSVTATTIDTVTVFDPYGYTPRSASANENDCGVIVKQNRGRSVASAVLFDRCSLFGVIGGAFDLSNVGPALDLGGTSASDTRIYQCYFSGGNAWNWPTLPNNYDPSRTQIAILADPGAGTLSGASFQMYDSQMQTGHVVWNPQATEAHIYIDQLLADSAGNALPTVVCGTGNPYCSVKLDRIGQADADQPAVTIGTGYDKLKVQIGDIYSSNPNPVVAGSLITGPTNVSTGLWLNSTTTKTPWATGWQTKWSAGLSTPHAGINWASPGVVQSRFANLFPVFGSWVGGGGQPPTLPTGVTATMDGVGPGGSGVAIKLSCTNSFDGSQIIVGSYPATLSASVDDYIVVGCWINSPASDAFGDTNLTLSSYAGGDIAFNGFELTSNSFVRVGRHIGGTGWQWCYKVAKVTAIGNGHYYIAFNAPTNAATKEYLFYGPTVVKAPITLGENDLAEWAGNLRHQSMYGAAGTVGTMDNERFVAHGGLGVGPIARYAVGVASGQITLGAATGAAVEVFDEAGNSLGVVAPLSFTVNP